MLDGLMASLQSGQDERVEMQKKMTVPALTEEQKSWLRDESTLFLDRRRKRVDLVAMVEKHIDYIRQLIPKAIKGDKDAEEDFYAALEGLEGMLEGKEPVLITAIGLLYTNMFQEFPNDMEVALKWLSWGAARGDKFAKDFLKQ